jgi:hypothetical protein
MDYPEFNTFLHFILSRTVLKFIWFTEWFNPKCTKGTTRSIILQWVCGHLQFANFKFSAV